MKKLLLLLFVCIVSLSQAQTDMYRHLTQTAPAPGSYYANCEIKNSVRTKDHGYIFSFLPWSPNLHSASPVDYYTIKTDSNFVPQWKKPYYASSISLPTGGIVLVYNSAYGTRIEKVTSSGAQVWSKSFSGEDILLNDGVSFGSRLRFVGRKRILTGFFPQVESSQPYTLLMDTSGTFISQSTFTTSNGSSIDFGKIKRDAQGNFFVHTLPDPFSITSMCLAKFDTAFSFQWAKTGSPVYFTDIDISANGRIFASGLTGLGASMAANLFKLDGQGNLLAQSQFNGRYKISGLCKKPNGNYLVSMTDYDSLFTFEADTSLNLAWHKFIGHGMNAGSSVIQNNRIHTPFFYRFPGHEPVIVSSDINGNSCSSYSIAYSQVVSTATLTSFTLSPVTSSAAIASSTLNEIGSQAYLDSCNCPVFIPVNQSTLCVGNTGTINIVGSGNVSWYASATGNSFIQSGNQFVYSSNTPTVKTVFAQDSACGLNPTRTQIDITVYAVPVLTLIPANPYSCGGSYVFVNAPGAINYTWSGSSSSSGSNAYNPSVATSYTVTGSVAPGCSDTRTFTVRPAPNPTLSLITQTGVCVGTTITLTGGNVSNSYTWTVQGGTIVSTSPSLIASPTTTGPVSYLVAASNGSCIVNGNTSITGYANPTLSVAGPGTVCAGRAATFTVSGANTYTWSNLVHSSSAIYNPTVASIYSVTGTHVNGCGGSQTVAVAVVPDLTLTAGPSFTSVCEGTPVTFSSSGASTYSWNNGSTLSSFTFTAPPGQTIYMVTGSNGVCSSTAQAFANAYTMPTLLLTSNPATLCAGGSATITALGASTYSWSNASTSNSFVVTPASSTVYTVYGTNGLCVAFNALNLPVYPNPTLMLSSSDLDICPGENVTVLATGAQYYLWNTGATSNILYQTPQGSSSYTVKGTNQFGCTDTQTVGVTMHALPVITLNSSNLTICAGQSATLSAAGALSYSWNAMAGSATQVISPSATSVYTVIAVDAYGCTGSATILQQVSICTGLNVFSVNDPQVTIFPNPNNGVFNIHLTVWQENMRLEVYTALAQLIQSETLPAQSTAIDLSTLPAGIYYLKILDLKRANMLKIIKE